LLLGINSSRWGKGNRKANWSCVLSLCGKGRDQEKGDAVVKERKRVAEETEGVFLEAIWLRSHLAETQQERGKYRMRKSKKTSWSTLPIQRRLKKKERGKGRGESKTYDTLDPVKGIKSKRFRHGRKSDWG